MTARTLPTMPSWTANQEITSSLLNQITTYAQFWANPPSFRAEQHASQNITSGSNTQVTCETVIHDSDSGLSLVTPFSYVVPFAGIWDFDGMVGIAFNATGWRGPQIYQNGTVINGAQPIYAPSTITSATPALAKGVVCNVGDVIALYFGQNSGSTLATPAGGAQCSWFAGTLRSLQTP